MAHQENYTMPPAWPTRSEMYQRRMWMQALLRVYRGARGRDKGLEFFSAAWAYGCRLVKLS
jgi:hypothetical protein